VATATTTPAITLSTTVTGLLKGNGTAISAASSGTDYAPATSGTSILYGNGAGGFSNVTIGTGVSFAAGTLSATGSGGTVTSVAALTLGTTGTDLSSTVANSTTTPVITLNVPTASAANRGALSAADWTTFNDKAPGVTFTTNYIPYGQGTTTLNQSAGLQFDGTNFTTTGYATATSFIPSSSTIPTNGMYLPAANSVGFATNSTNAIYITATQLVGIGTSDPTGGFTGYGAAAKILGITGTGAALIGSYGAVHLYNNRATPAATDIFGIVAFASSNSVSGQSLKAYIAGYADGAGGVTGGFGGALRLYTKPDNSATGATERMRIFSTGGVSIGNTADPGATNLSVTGFASAASFRPTSATIPTNGMYLPAANSVGIATNSAERMRITSTGALLVGATSAISSEQVQIQKTAAGSVANNLRLTNTGSTVGSGSGIIFGANTNSGAHIDLAGIQVGSSAATSGYMALATTNSGVYTERMRIDSAGNTYVETGTLWQYAPAPTSKAAVATLTAAEVQTGILNTTGTTYTVTLPTGTALDTAFAGVPATNIGFDWFVVNTASGTITIAVGASGMTSVGTLTIATGVSAQFRLRRTAANTYVLYRLG
jgi:hypothetical protein